MILWKKKFQEFSLPLYELSWDIQYKINLEFFLHKPLCTSSSSLEIAEFTQFTTFFFLIPLKFQDEEFGPYIILLAGFFSNSANFSFQSSTTIISRAPIFGVPTRHARPVHHNKFPFA